MEQYRNACRNLPADITAAEAEGRREVILSVTVSGSDVVSSVSSDVTTVSVTAQGAAGVGYAFTQNLDETPADVIQRAWEGSRISGAGKAVFGTDAPVLPESPNRMPDMLSVREAAEEAQLLEQWSLEADPVHVVQAVVTVGSYETDLWTVNSAGLSASSSHRWYDASVGLVVRLGGRTYNTAWCTSVSSLTQLQALKEDLCVSIRRSILGMGEPVSFESGTYRVLLSRESLCQMLVCMWQPFSGVRQMNGASCLCGCMDQQIGSPALSISDSAFLPDCGYGRAMDTEGSAAGSRMLMENGVMKGRLHNRCSADHFHELPTGNAARAEGFFSGLPTGSTAAPNVTAIVPGELREEDMFRRLGDGVWITQTYDPFHSIEPASGDFAIPCNGVLIRDGKPAGILNSLTITGNLLDLWKQVEAVGDTVRYWRFYTGMYYLGGADLLIRRLQVNA